MGSCLITDNLLDVISTQLKISPRRQKKRRTLPHNGNTRGGIGESRHVFCKQAVERVWDFIGHCTGNERKRERERDRLFILHFSSGGSIRLQFSHLTMSGAGGLLKVSSDPSRGPLHGSTQCDAVKSSFVEFTVFAQMKVNRQNGTPVPAVVEHASELERVEGFEELLA